MRALFLLPALGLALIGIGRSTPVPIIGVNDAPVLNTAASPLLRPAYLGAGAPVNGTVAGTPVSLLVDFATPVDGLDNVTDLDVAESDASGSAQLGIASLVRASTLPRPGHKLRIEGYARGRLRLGGESQEVSEGL